MSGVSAIKNKLCQTYGYYTSFECIHKFNAVDVKFIIDYDILYDLKILTDFIRTDFDMDDECSSAGIKASAQRPAAESVMNTDQAIDSKLYSGGKIKLYGISK